MIELLLMLSLSQAEVKDAESLRFVYSTEQGYDTSCGLTSLACLMNTYWGIPADELALANEFLVDKVNSGDYTVSFADMTRILKAKGFTTAAYKLSFDQLAAAVGKYAPVLVHYDKPDGHFALALKVVGDSLILADPAEGTTLCQKEFFTSRWSGNALFASYPGRRALSETIAKAVESVTGRKELMERASLVGMGSLRW